MVSDTEQAHTRTRTEDGRSTFDLLKDLRDDARRMLRQEIALARAETSEKVGRVVRNAAFLLIGAAIAYAAFLFLLVAATYGIVIGLAAGGLGVEIVSWLAPLITALVVGAIGLALIGKGIATLRSESLTPKKTVQSLEESRQWIASETRQMSGR
jgi:hypothetical protein